MSKKDTIDVNLHFIFDRISISFYTREIHWMIMILVRGLEDINHIRKAYRKVYEKEGRGFQEILHLDFFTVFMRYSTTIPVRSRIELIGSTGPGKRQACQLRDTRHMPLNLIKT